MSSEESKSELTKEQIIEKIIQLEDEASLLQEQLTVIKKLKTNGLTI